MTPTTGRWNVLRATRSARRPVPRVNTGLPSLSGDPQLVWFGLAWLGMDLVWLGLDLVWIWFGGALC